MPQWNVGDVVRLKSGGPKMTVSMRLATAVGSPSNRVKCSWWDPSKNDMRSETFGNDALEAVEDSESSD